jgi:hypothetical protein
MRSCVIFLSLFFLWPLAQEINEGIELYARTGGPKMKKGDLLCPYNLMQKAVNFRRLAMSRTGPLPTLVGITLAMLRTGALGVASSWLGAGSAWEEVRTDAVFRLNMEPKRATPQDVSMMLYGKPCSAEAAAAAEEQAAAAKPQTAQRRREVNTQDEMVALFTGIIMAGGGVSDD